MPDRFPQRLALVLCAAVLAVAGCGGDTGGTEDEAGGELAGEPTTNADPDASIPQGEPPYTLSELEGELQEAGVIVKRIGPGTADAGAPGIVAEIDIDTLQAARYQETRTSEKFDVIVFPDRDTARRAIAQLRDTDTVEGGGQVVTAENLAVVADRRFDTPVLSRVHGVLRDLSQAGARDG